MALPLAARRSDASPFGWTYQPWRGGILQVCAQATGEREPSAGAMLLTTVDFSDGRRFPNLEVRAARGSRQRQWDDKNYELFDQGLW